MITFRGEALPLNDKGKDKVLKKNIVPLFPLLFKRPGVKK